MPGNNYTDGDLRRERQEENEFDEARYELRMEGEEGYSHRGLNCRDCIYYNAEDCRDRVPCAQFRHRNA